MSINHLRGVRKLLRYGTLPHMRNAAGQTPLHLALLTGKLKAARLLLERSVAMRAETKKPLQYLINVQVRTRTGRRDRAHMRSAQLSQTSSTRAATGCARNGYGLNERVYPNRPTALNPAYTLGNHDAHRQTQLRAFRAYL